jgi:Putative auto-transporter adhesin, head GIN domain
VNAVHERHVSVRSASAAAGRHRTDVAPVGRCRCLAALIAALSGAGCAPYLQGNGLPSTETRQVSPFGGVSVGDAIALEVTCGAAQSVMVSGDQNVLPHILTDVRVDPEHGAILEVSSDVKSFASETPLRVVVSMPALSFAAATGLASVVATSVASAALEADASGGGWVRLSGSGGASLAVRATAGSVDARAYPVDDADVTLASGALADLAVRARVSGNASGASTLQNFGTATCDVTASNDSTVRCPASSQ